MSEEEYNFYTTHSYQLPDDIYKKYTQFVISQIPSVLSTINQLIDNGTPQKYCPTCVEELIHLIHTFIHSQTGDDNLKHIDILQLDNLLVKCCIAYPYSSLLHGRVKKVYKSILISGENTWVQGIFTCFSQY